MKPRIIFLGILILALVILPNALAGPYDVNRAFSNNADNATLIGAINVPIGSYMIVNKGATPFTASDLTLISSPADLVLSDSSLSFLPHNRCLIRYDGIPDSEATYAGTGNVSPIAFGRLYTVSRTATVPEPASLVLIGTGLGALGFAEYWRKRK